MEKKDATEMLFRLVIFGLCALPLHIILLLVPMPSLLGLGEIRIVLTGILARIGEEALFRAFKSISL